MITAAALCPHPPLLFRELTGQQDVAAELRTACLDVVRRAIADADRVAVVGGADEARAWDPGSAFDVRRFGTTATRPPRAGGRLPLSLGVGRRLLDEAGWTGPTELDSVRWDATADEATGLVRRLGDLPGRTALLVLGEGSTRRGASAPGFLDERAFPFDDEIADAVEAGDGQALLVVDPGLAEELMVLGRAAFAVLGATAAGRVVHPELSYRDDPFGVTYLVALWALG